MKRIWNNPLWSHVPGTISKVDGHLPVPDPDGHQMPPWTFGEGTQSSACGSFPGTQWSITHPSTQSSCSGNQAWCMAAQVVAGGTGGVLTRGATAAGCNRVCWISSKMILVRHSSCISCLCSRWCNSSSSVGMGILAASIFWEDRSSVIFYRQEKDTDVGIRNTRDLLNTGRAKETEKMKTEMGLKTGGVDHDNDRTFRCELCYWQWITLMVLIMRCKVQPRRWTYVLPFGYSRQWGVFSVSVKVFM